MTSKFISGLFLSKIVVPAKVKAILPLVNGVKDTIGTKDVEFNGNTLIKSTQA